MAQESNKKTILIVDDEALYRRPLAVKLEKNNFNVLEAADGEEGLSIAVENKPNLILLDLKMPKMDGMTMFRKLRDYNEYGKSVPVFLLTVLPSSDDQRMKDVSELDPTYYLEKTEHTIDEVIEKILDRLKMII